MAVGFDQMPRPGSFRLKPSVCLGWRAGDRRVARLVSSLWALDVK